jgi:hypothetical protein
MVPKKFNAMKKNFRYIPYVASLLTGLLLTVSCVTNNEDEPPVVPFVPGNVVSISDVKALYSAELAKTDYKARIPIEITEDWAIKGVITASDKKDGNLYKEAYVQDGSSAILLKFDSTGGLEIGDSVIVNLQGLFLGDYGNFIQLGGIPYTDDSGNYRVSGFNKDKAILKTSVGNLTYPEVVTITQAKSSNYLGKLVRFQGVQFNSGMNGLTYATVEPPTTENRTLEDCDGKNIIVRTSGYATFAGRKLPVGRGDMVGIVTVFNSTYQLIIRNIDEVTITDNKDDRCGQSVTLGAPVETIDESFTGLLEAKDIALNGWVNFTESGNRMWQSKVFGSEVYAQATGYNSKVNELIIWLMTPPVTISTAKQLSFDTSQDYWAHTGTNKPFEVLYSTDFTGNNLSSATWNVLPARLATSTDPIRTWFPSGNIDLPVINGKTAVIAFRYKGSQTESTTYRVDNIKVVVK